MWRQLATHRQDCWEIAGTLQRLVRRITQFSANVWDTVSDARCETREKTAAKTDSQTMDIELGWNGPWTPHLPTTYIWLQNWANGRLLSSCERRGVLDGSELSRGCLSAAAGMRQTKEGPGRCAIRIRSFLSYCLVNLGDAVSVCRWFSHALCSSNSG